MGKVGVLGAFVGEQAFDIERDRVNLNSLPKSFAILGGKRYFFLNRVSMIGKPWNIVWIY